MLIITLKYTEDESIHIALESDSDGSESGASLPLNSRQATVKSEDTLRKRNLRSSMLIIIVHVYRVKISLLLQTLILVQLKRAE